MISLFLAPIVVMVIVDMHATRPHDVLPIFVIFYLWIMALVLDIKNAQLLKIVKRGDVDVVNRQE